MYLAQVATDIAEATPMWSQIVYAVITALVAAFLLPYIKRQSEKARAEAENIAGSARDKLLGRVKAMALDEAYIIAEKRLPDLAQQALAKKLDGEAVKAELRSWGESLKIKLKDYFQDSEGIDLAAVLGDKILDDIIRWAADKTSPFPGKSTAVALLQDDWSNRLVKYGTDWVRTNWLKQTDEEA